MKRADYDMTDSEAVIQLVISELFDDLVMDKVAIQTYTRKELLPKLAKLEETLKKFL
jgi:hypothetical protein